MAEKKVEWLFVTISLLASVSTIDEDRERLLMSGTDVR